MSSILSTVPEAAAGSGVLESFVYGEHFEGARSLGFRLVSPDTTRPWTSEIEALARRLQAAPYPDDWPVAELFCSVLLEGGQRLIAIARYGLTDHTPSRRRGGLEMVGVVGPATLSTNAVLSIGHWLRQRRTGPDRLANWAGSFEVVEVLAEAPTPPPLIGSALPRPLGPERFLVIPAAAGSDPDLHLGMLNFLPERNWQWLPFVPADFSLAELAERGPVLAWTTPQAVRRAHTALLPGAATAPARRSAWLPVLVVFLIFLLGANAWCLWRIEDRLADIKPAPTPAGTADRATPKTGPAVQSDVPAPPDQDALAQALFQYLRNRGCVPESRREQLLKNYDRLAAADESMRVESLEGRLAIGALIDLTKRKSPAQVEALIRGLAAEQKGLDKDVLGLIAERVYQRLTESE